MGLHQIHEAADSRSHFAIETYQDWDGTVVEELGLFGYFEGALQRVPSRALDFLLAPPS